MLDFVKTCEHAARTGGHELLRWKDHVKPRTKAPADFVTEADLASQQAIQKIVLDTYPSHEFLGEEDAYSGPVVSAAEAYRWIVDPLDGTTNYIHGLDHFCVSVALEHQGEVIAGCIYDPIRDEAFTAARGDGAKLNGSRINASTTVRLNEALVAASFPAKVESESPELRLFVRMIPKCRAIRRMGSAALNLCYVAAGRLDAYWATSVKTWDVAAGVLLVAEAGGVVSSVDGSSLDLARPKLAVSATPELHAELIRALNAPSSC
jgi:myo-inositol-1(or 4)-monophosphatase